MSLLATEVVLPNTPSTQRTPGPSTSSHGGAPANAQAAAPSTLELDGLHDLDGQHDGEEQRVASWLHLSLGLETG